MYSVVFNVQNVRCCSGDSTFLRQKLSFKNSTGVGILTLKAFGSHYVKQERKKVNSIMKEVKSDRQMEKECQLHKAVKTVIFFLSYFIFVLGFLLCDSFGVQFSQHREKQRKMRGGSR